MDKSVAKEYIDLTQLFETTTKDFVIDNLDRIFGYPQTYRKRRNKESVDKISLLAEITETEKIDTVRAWFNRSRDNVKIPLLKLCKIAEYANINVEDILTTKIPVSRDWRKLDAERAEIFSQIDERDYYEGGIWNVNGLIAKMYSLEDYSDCSSVVDKLSEDCCRWFGSVLEIKAGKFIDDIRNEVEEFLRNEV